MTYRRPGDALAIMLANPDVFRTVARDLDKYGRSLMKKQVKASTTLTKARRVADALGDDLLPIGLDMLTVREVGILLKRLDRNHDGLSDLEPVDQRQHLMGLFDGRIKPKGKPKKAQKTADDAEAETPPPPPQPEPERPLTEAEKFFRHKSMGARRKSARPAPAYLDDTDLDD